MLHDKDIKNLSKLKSLLVHNHKKEEYCTKITDLLEIGKLHAIFSKVKTKGILTILLIRIFISFEFIGVNNVYCFIDIIDYLFKDADSEKLFTIIINDDIRLLRS